jgi:hypothetical protein
MNVSDRTLLEVNIGRDRDRRRHTEQMNNYSNGLDPPLAAIFIDDARISTTR